ncbi:unnamed protein product, partial [Owenia fusiformis]
MKYTDIKPNVKVITLEDAIFYHCMVHKDGTDANMFFTKQNNSLPIQVGNIIASAQAGGMLHKVENVKQYDGFTIFHGKFASLEEAIEYTDFEMEAPLETIDDPVTIEEVPDSDLLEVLLSGEGTISNVPNVTVISEENIYKCVGRLFHAEDDIHNEISSVTLVLLTKDLTETYKKGGVLIGNATKGYLEVIKTISTSAKIAVTSLLDCSTEKHLLHKIITSTTVDSEATKGGKRMICPGGDNWPALQYFHQSQTDLTHGDIIVGRPSGAFLLQIYEVTSIGEFTFIEGLPLTDEIKNKTYVPAEQKRIKRKTYSKTWAPRWRYGTPTTVNFGGGVSMKFDPYFIFTPSLTLFAEVGIWPPFIYRVGADLSGTLKTGLTVTVTFENGFEKTWEKQLVDKTLRRFIIMVFAIPIPGKIYFKLDFEAKVWAKAKAFVEGHIGATAVTTMGAAWTDSNGLRITRPTFDVTFQKGLTGKVDKKETEAGARSTLTPKLGVAWPSTGLSKNDIPWWVPGF